MNVVPIKVKIGLRLNGQADHPNWLTLPIAGTGSDAEREQAIKSHSHGGWYYDKVSGHEDDTPDSPRGVQYGMRFVSPQFAAEAMGAYPALVTRMTESEVAAFWNERVWVRSGDERYDTDVLQGLKAARDLLVAVDPTNTTALTALDTKIRKALDPTDPEPGVRANLLRRFATAKSRLGITFDASVLP
jgi:hypothetical protein